MKKIITQPRVIVMAILLLIAFIALFLVDINLNTQKVERGKVIAVVRQVQTPTDDDPFPGQVVKVKVTTGQYKGQVVESYNVFSGNPRYDIPVEPGQRVILSLDEDENQLNSATISSITRDWPITLLAIAFLIVMVFFGRKDGLKAVISLIFTFLIFFKVLLPLILHGYSPTFITIVLSSLIAVFSLLLVGGWDRRTLAAILGIVSSIACTGLLTFSFGHLAKLTGFGTNEAQILSFTQEYDLNFQGILFASMLFSLLGAVIDIGFTVASQVETTYFNNPIARPIVLFKAGVKSGRSKIGKLSNILIYAYAGCSLPLMLIMAGYQPSFFKIINVEIVASEIIRAFISTLGIFLAIPLTAAFCAWLIYEDIMLKYYT